MFNVKYMKFVSKIYVFVIPILKCQIIKNTLDPAWPPFNLPVNTLCNGDYNRPIKVSAAIVLMMEGDS